jgi:hypothetical protein
MMAEDEERSAKLASLARCKQQGEKAYDDMYEASFRDSDVFYSNAKEFFYDAIRLAGELGLNDEADVLSRRLQHIKEVFRSQFSR